MHRGRRKSTSLLTAPERINLRRKRVAKQRRVRKESIMSNIVNKQTPDTNRQESKIIIIISNNNNNYSNQTEKQQNYRNS